MNSKVSFVLLSVLVAAQLMIGCSDEEEDAVVANNERRYTLSPLDNSGVSGSVVFSKVDAQTTRIAIEVSGTAAGNSHPAHLHSGKAGSGGGIVLDLTPVDGSTGKSETMVTRLNNGTMVTYEQLIGYDGHVNLHKSAAELAIMIAQGDVGSNAATTSPTPSPDGGY